MALSDQVIQCLFVVVVGGLPMFVVVVRVELWTSTEQEYASEECLGCTFRHAAQVFSRIRVWQPFCTSFQFVDNEIETFFCRVTFHIEVVRHFLRDSDQWDTTVTFDHFEIEVSTNETGFVSQTVG